MREAGASTAPPGCVSACGLLRRSARSRVCRADAQRRGAARRLEATIYVFMWAYIYVHASWCLRVPSFIVVAVTRRLPPPLTDSTAALTPK